MEVQFNSSNAITGDDDVRRRVQASLRQKLDRLSDTLTRVEIHLSDENGPRGGTDKRAVLEGRPRGRAPVTVVHTADTVDAATAGAADKLLTAMERERGRLTTRKGH